MTRRREREQASIAEMVAQQVAAVIPGIVQQLQQVMQPQPTLIIHVEPIVVEHRQTLCTFKRFNPYQRPNNAPTRNNRHPIRRDYGGNNPICNTCNYSHNSTVPCRLCTNCGRFGHTSNVCRSVPNPTPNHENQNQNQPSTSSIAPMQIRVCYECGDPTHIRNQCPLLANSNGITKGCWSGFQQ